MTVRETKTGLQLDVGRMEMATLLRALALAQSAIERHPDECGYNALGQHFGAERRAEMADIADVFVKLNFAASAKWPTKAPDEDHATTQRS